MGKTHRSRPWSERQPPRRDRQAPVRPDQSPEPLPEAPSGRNEGGAEGKKLEWTRDPAGRAYGHPEGYCGGRATGHKYTLRLRKGETVTGCRRQPRKRAERPCGGCFMHAGRMWLLRGAGAKSVHKNKAMRRERDRAALDRPVEVPPDNATPFQRPWPSFTSTSLYPFPPTDRRPAS